MAFLKNHLSAEASLDRDSSAQLGSSASIGWLFSPFRARYDPIFLFPSSVAEQWALRPARKRMRRGGELISPAKRMMDVTGAFLLLVVLSPLLVFLAFIVKITSEGPAVYTSDRIGANNRVFRMPKFRSMRVDTPEVAPHLLADASSYVSPIGSFLRKSSLDELPQLWSILLGDLSFVGPRPALYNESELVAMRTEAGVHRLTPGLSGWAQVNGRNALSMPDKVRRDAEYLERRCLSFDLQIIGRTVVKVLRRADIMH